MRLVTRRASDIWLASAHAYVRVTAVCFILLYRHLVRNRKTNFDRFSFNTIFHRGIFAYLSRQNLCSTSFFFILRTNEVTCHIGSKRKR